MKINLLLFILILFSCSSKNDFRSIGGVEFAKRSSEPFLYSSGDNLIISWTENKYDTNYLYTAEYLKDSWDNKELITDGQDWFVNWADFPSISYNEVSNVKLSHHLQKSSKSTFSYDINYHFFKEGRWLDRNKLHNDETKTEHGFVSSFPYKDGFVATWLDGRNTNYDKKEMDGHASGPMNLRSAFISSKGDIYEDHLVDEMVCDCCQTSVTVSSGIPIVVYRDRSRDEKRDISISRYIEGNWTKPVSIHDDNWIINGCPVNGPNIDSNGDKVVVSWFSASNGVPKVSLKFSRDNGMTFGNKIMIDDIINLPTGRVDAEFISDDEVVVSWLSSFEGKGSLFLRKININGNQGEIKKIDDISMERSTGFPQIEKFQDDLIIAYTDSGSEEKRIKTFKMSISSL